MFCKYCGGNLASGDAKCKRCGKEVAARSNCGGFYDLVQEDEMPQPAQPARPAAVIMPQKMKNPTGLIVGVAAGFALLLVLIAVLIVKQSQLNEELDTLKNELQDIIELQETEPESTETVDEETETNEEETQEKEELNITIPELFEKEEEATEDTTVPEV